MKCRNLFTLLFLLCTTNIMWAQIANKDVEPRSFTQTLISTNVPTVQVDRPANEAEILKGHHQREEDGLSPFIGWIVPSNITLNNSGRWDVLPDGSKLWRLQITSAGAQSLMLYMEDFWIPKGARIHIYTPNKRHIDGAFDHRNNHDHGNMVMGLLPGETVIVEYLEPMNVKPGRFTISEIGHAYRDIPMYGAEAMSTEASVTFGSSAGCQANVNCSPEGTGKGNQRDAVARIIVKTSAGFGYCTGTLINNVRQDCTPYFLTALHCGLATQGVNSSIASTADFNQWRFDFNFQATGCSNPGSSPSFNSITGATLRAHSNDGGGNYGSDMLLLEIQDPSSTLPTYGTYLAGWDRNFVVSTGGYGIHHPAGDIKKITNHNGSTSITSWGQLTGQTNPIANTHWALQWSVTTNAPNGGDTEGGSSGSGLFNSSGRLVGSLTGGNSTVCPNGGDNSFYGTMTHHWDQNGTTANRRLKNWLDPDNTGATTLDGTIMPCAASGDDAGIELVQNPMNNTYLCDNPFIPEVVLRNFGSTTLTSATINYQIDNGPVSTQAWTGSLASGNTTTVTLPSTSITPGTGFTFRAYTTNPNATTDGNYSNDTATAYTVHLVANAPPYSEAFNAGAAPGNIAISDGGADGLEWEYTTDATASGSGAGFGSFMYDNYNPPNGNGVGVLDWFYLPTFDFSGQSGHQMTFDVAYAQYGAGNSDSLIVVINSTCGTSFTPIYFKGGTDLSTNGGTPLTSEFTPTGTQWRNESIDLSAYAGASHVRIAFINLSGWGNRLFVDNINVQAGAVTLLDDAGIDSIANPADNTVFCTSPFDPEVRIRNFGTSNLTSATINYQIDNGAVSTYAWTGNLAPNASQLVTLPSMAGPGTGAPFTFRAYTSSPNAGTDNDITNDTASAYTQEIIGQPLPYSEAVDAGTVPLGLTIAQSPVDTITWQYTTGVSGYGTGIGVPATNNGTLLFNNFSVDISGTLDYLFLPWLNLAGQTGVQMTFDVAYSPYNATYSDTLDVLISTDCGQSYTTLYSKGGADLSTNGGVSTGAFQPAANEWRTETISIPNGLNNVRIAFLNRSGYGNYLYVDNINIQAAVPCNLTASVGSSSNVTCNGGSDGSITIAAANGTPNYSYDIGSGNQSSATFSNLTASTYTITVTDGAGCTATTSNTISQPSVVSGSVSAQQNVSCFGDNTGSLTIAASGGSGTGYTYNRGTGAQSSGVFTGLIAGSYTITVSDGSGCTGTVSGTVTQPASALTASAGTPTNPTCFGGTGSVLISANGGTSSYTFDIGSGSQLNGSFSNLSDGTYTATVTDALGCETTTGVTITQPSLVNASISSSTNASCNGATDGAVTLTASGGSGSGYTFNLGSGSQSSGSFSNLASGSYTATVADGNGCSTTLPVNIGVSSTAISASASATSNFGGSNVSCNGSSDGTATATSTNGSGAVTYVWSQGFTGAAASGLSGGTYTITATDAAGCSDVTFVTLTEPSAVSATISSQTNVDCNSNNTGALTVSGSGGTPSYTYNIGSGAQSGGTFTGLTAASYLITVTDLNGCTASTSGTITEPTALGASATDNGNGSTTASGANGTPNYTYLWDASASSQTTATATGLTGGTYNVTVTDANGCTATASVSVVITGIDDVPNVEQFEVNPNPNTGQFTIQVSLLKAQDATVRVTNVLGQNLLEFNKKAQEFSIPIDIQEQASGVYFITLSTDEKAITKKVVVDKQ
ncbi:MAG: T9SS type A sorting domain-containing protein [Aureispira sp.]|nr:T9SS type A sorting domain-containing protein [Aureispira sp.]